MESKPNKDIKEDKEQLKKAYAILDNMGMRNATIKDMRKVMYSDGIELLYAMATSIDAIDTTIYNHASTLGRYSVEKLRRSIDEMIKARQNYLEGLTR